MNSGQLKHRVTVQKLAVTRDSTGEELETWSNVGTRWAKIEQVKGSENYQRSGETSTAIYNVHMRYEAGLLSTDRRLVYGSQYLDIESLINVDEANVEYELSCKAKT